MFGAKCSSCGYKEFPELLEIHHINYPHNRPKWSEVRDWEWSKVREETLRYCTVLCPNCHKEKHHIHKSQLPPHDRSVYGK